MKKTLLYFLVLTSIMAFGQAPFDDVYWQGSFAIVGYNTHGGVNGNGNEEIALMVLKPMDRGTIIYITNKAPGKTFNLGTSSLPTSSGTKGTAYIELIESVSPGQLIFVKGINPSGTAQTSYGEISIDGKFQLGNGEAWLFYVSKSAYTNGSTHKPDMFCGAFLWGDSWQQGNGGNAYNLLTVTGLTDGKNAMKNDVTNNAWKCGKCTGVSFNLDDALSDIENAGIYNGDNPALVLNNPTNDGSGGTWIYAKPNNGQTWENTACDFAGLANTISYTPIKYDGTNWKNNANNKISEPDNKFAKDIEIDNSGGTVTSSDIYESGSGSGTKKVRAGKLKVKTGTTLEILPGDTLQVTEELTVEAGADLIFKAAVDVNGNITYPEYYNSLSTLSPGTDITVEQYIVEPYWHHLCSPVHAALNTVVFDKNIVLPGYTVATDNFELRNATQIEQNIYYWEHDYNDFGWERELDFNEDFSDKAYTIFFKPSEIPVKMTAKGPLVHPDNNDQLQPTSFFNDFNGNGGTATCNSPGYGAPAYWNNTDKLGGCADFEGWNFIRNPFAGYMNWKAAINANKDAKDYQGNILYNTTVYVWDPDAGSANHYQGSNNGGATNDVTIYGEFNYANVLSNNVDILSIPPFQAFFVHQENWVDNVIKTQKNDIKIGGAAKGKASSNKTAYKTTDFDGVRFKLQVSDLKGFDNDVLLYFGDRGSNYYDPAYDAPKFVSGNYNIPLVGTIQDSTLLGIDARENVVSEPLTIDMAVIYAKHGAHLTLELLPIETIPFSVAVKDKVTGKIHNFKDGIYNFTNDTLFYNTRFEVLINYSPNNLNNQVFFDSDISMYAYDDKLVLDPIEHFGPSTIVVSNIVGQVLNTTKANILRGQTTELTIKETGVIVVSIYTDSGKTISRKIVK